MEVRHYLDTSVVLAWLLEAREHLAELAGSRLVASSRLMWIEVSRGIHRALQTGRLDIAQATHARRAFARFATGVSQLRLTEEIYVRAEGPYALPVRTLDAIHLASAEIWLASQTERDPGRLAVWTLDERMNHCAAQLGYLTPLLA